MKKILFTLLLLTPLIFFVDSVDALSIGQPTSLFAFTNNGSSYVAEQPISYSNWAGYSGYEYDGWFAFMESPTDYNYSSFYFGFNNLNLCDGVNCIIGGTFQIYASNSDISWVNNEPIIVDLNDTLNDKWIRCSSKVSVEYNLYYNVNFSCAANNINSANFVLSIPSQPTVESGGFRVGLATNDFTITENINQGDVIVNQNNNTQDIINNQNQNQQQTNEKLDKVNDAITDETENSDGTCKGIICNLKKVVKGVIDLPKNIINLMINALKSLFIPDDMDFINDFVSSIETKLGFIAEIPMSIIDFTLNLANATWDEVTSISLPSIDIFGYKFWNSQEIDISEGINIFKPFKYVTDCLCVVILSRGLLKCWENFTGGGE